MNKNNPHDNFFKEIFTVLENAIDFLMGILPEDILHELDISSLRLDNNSYVDEELDEFYSDLVYDCYTNEKYF